jgi:Spy/CpxP family protein refolding chaperone
MSDMTKAKTTGRPFWRRPAFWTVAVALTVLGTAVVAVPTAMAFRGLGGYGGHGFGHGMMENPERAKAHAAFAVEWAFRAVDATEQQKEDGRIVVEQLVDRLVPLREKHLAHREAVARELVQARIDRAALEHLRTEGLGLADEATRIMVDGVADLAEVLTPEQRAELLELIHRFHGGEHPPLG